MLKHRPVLKAYAVHVLRLLKGFLIVSCKCTLISHPLCCPVATFDSFWCLFFFPHFLVQASTLYPFLITRLIFTLGSPPNHFSLSLSGSCFIVPSLSLLLVQRQLHTQKPKKLLKAFLETGFHFFRSSDIGCMSISLFCFFFFCTFIVIIY